MPRPETTDLREELADDGTATGVEAEDVVDDRIAEPFDPDEITVTTRTMTVDLLMGRLTEGVLKLQPDFQRKAGIWNDVKQSRLIESLLLRIPLPSFYVSEDRDEEWEVVDGVQRLTAIRRFVRPAAEGDALRLRGLEYLKADFEGSRYSDLPPRLIRRIRETEFTFHVIQSNTPEAVRFNIFARINTGGMPLTHQELRHALVPGQARGILKDWAEGDAFKRATSGSIRPDRMADREMVLRYFAFWRMETPESYSERDFGQFLMDGMRAMNDMDSLCVREARGTFESAMETAYDTFGADAFRKSFSPVGRRKPVNRALFECIAVNVAKMGAEEQARLVSECDAVQSRFRELMNEDAGFVSAISVSTGDPAKVRLRFGRIRELFEDVVDA